MEVAATHPVDASDSLVQCPLSDYVGDNRNTKLVRALFERLGDFLSEVLRPYNGSHVVPIFKKTGYYVSTNETICTRDEDKGSGRSHFFYR